MNKQELASLREKFVLTNEPFDSAEISALFGEIYRLQAERDMAVEDMRLIVGDVITEKKCYICTHYIDGDGCNDPEAENDNGDCHWQWHGLEEQG
jgi:hypothetical protein